MSWFFIESKLNGLVLDIKGGSVKGAQIITWPKHGGSNQLWAWSGDLLVSKTGYVLDVYGSRTANCTSAIAWDKHGCNNQRWEMVGDHIISKLNDFVLDIKGGCCESGVDVIMYPKHGGSNQQWKITYPEATLQAYSVAKAGNPGDQCNPERYKFELGEDGGGKGWTHLFAFWAYDYQAPGTTAYSVGYATSPVWRYRITAGESCGDYGWTHHFTFYAYSYARPETEAISTAWATDHVDHVWRYKATKGENAAAGQNWSDENMPTFWAYPNADACFGAVVVNHDEASRTYSSVWNNEAIGTGHAQSMLDSPLAWCALQNTIGEWMQIDLGTTMCVVGAVTQSRSPGCEQWVTSYKLWCSTDGTSFKELPQVYAANDADGNARKMITFEAVDARYVRFLPQTWHGHMSMRAGVIAKALEVNPGEASRTYSSVWNNEAIGTGHAQSMLDSPLAWCALENTMGQWMQIDLGTTMSVIGAVTQSRSPGYSQWVTSYKLSCSFDGTSFTELPHVYAANDMEGNAKTTISFEAVQARYVRFIPQTWHGHISMRAGVIAKAIDSDSYAGSYCVSLKSFHGKYMVAECDGTANANRDVARSYEVFTVEQKGYNRISLKSAHGKYLVAESNGTVNANREIAREWEEWDVEDLGEGKKALKSHHGCYLVAEQNGELNANRACAQTWETWTIEIKCMSLTGCTCNK